MTKRKPLIDANGEVRELTAADLRRFKPAAEVLPAELLKEIGSHIGTPVQQNRMGHLSKQLSGRHLLENEAMDAAAGDGLE
jgi:hypothetical protein